MLADHTFRIGTVLVEDGAVAAIAWNGDERAALAARASEVVDGSGCRLIPGLVDAHTHAYGTLLRGTESSLPLELWSLYTIAYGYGLDDRAIVAAMLLHDAECIRSGITGVVDHFPHIKHAHAALAAHELSGMRVLFAAFVQDLSDYDLLEIDVPPELRDITPVAPVDIPAYEALFADLAATAAGGSGRVRLALGPNAPQRCSDEVWAMWKRLRDRHGVPVHTHALETRVQQRLAHERWPGRGMIAAMDDAGLLDERLSLAHTIWTTAEERELLARRGVAVSHNPLSNLTIGSGIMPLRAYLDLGIAVGLGTDASNCAGRHDLFEAMRAALTLPRVSEPDPARWPDAATIFTLATANGSRIIGTENGAADVRVGAPADLVLMRSDLSVNVMFPATLDGFVAQAGREAVRSVMIAGEWVFRDGTILSFDETALLATVRDVHAEIAERAAHATPRIDANLAAVAAQLKPWTIPARA